ncbi:carbohydrate ABC transporter permease [Allostreptomyces psammosilenae]|uniref:Multiple sugar transport system permease protein n=1 Tax=Allostreptomyces psammosilenae TaxID=1892865 RepID=A0A852ZND9_9ACTN|nr:carbohydrate ABC transporter permease [Allostreptomyces psammosilenae]NYI03185.1 multiple sugar transport system permease protein [Allostreptomyces psammosilenae]
MARPPAPAPTTPPGPRRPTAPPSGPAHRRRPSRDRVERRLIALGRPVVLAGLAAITLGPFLFMLLLSVRPIEDLLLDPGRPWPAPDAVTADTYREVLRPVDAGGQGFGTLLANSAGVSLSTVALTLLVAVPGAYAVARFAFPGRRQAQGLFLAVYLFPSVLLAVPLFVIFARLGLGGSLPGLVLVYIAQTVPVSVYMLRNYFTSVPVSVEEAARVDGCSRLGTLWRVTLPLALPSLAATGLYVFMIAWNEFLFALLFLAADRELWTVSLGLAQLAGGIEVPKTVLMAGSVVLTVPVVVLFYLAERLLAEGLTAGAERA